MRKEKRVRANFLEYMNSVVSKQESALKQLSAGFVPEASIDMVAKKISKAIDTSNWQVEAQCVSKNQQLGRLLEANGLDKEAEAHRVKMLTSE